MAKRQTDKDRIEKGKWVNCWICETVFRRKRETKRYCSVCERGFCEGEHGSFAFHKGTCIICGAQRRPLVMGGSFAVYLATRRGFPRIESPA